MDVALLGLGGWFTVGAFRVPVVGSVVSVSVALRALAFIRCWCGAGGLLLVSFMWESY